jgi:diguanylate cyclase (GGDEF)-like protein
MRALIADDDRGVLPLLEAVLKRTGFDVVAARDGSEAWDQLCTAPHPSIAIVDWMMPEVDGLELCRRIRSDPALATVYVIVLTARDARADLVMALRAGADDYIVKPFDLEELQARVHVGLRVATLQERLAAQVIELERARDALDTLASSDALTNLYSRRRWFEIANAELQRYRRYGHPFSILMADLDYFKRVNDKFGHAVGDEVLKAFGQLLSSCARSSDSFGRLGGEEFAAVLSDSNVKAASDLASRIVESCRRMVIDTPSGPLTVTCSIGIAEASPDDQRVEDILNRADAGLYEAKRQGRNRVAVVTAVASMLGDRS